MSNKKEKDTKVKLTCPDCNEEMIVDEKDLEGTYGYKCVKCYHVFQIKTCSAFQWKCSRPNTPRQNPNKAGKKNKIAKIEKIEE